MQQNIILIYSGGVDSTTILYEYQKNIRLALSFKYNAKFSEEELKRAKYHCEKLGIKQQIVNLTEIFKWFDVPLLEGGERIPEGEFDSESIKKIIIPYRNGIMLSIAAGFAEYNNCDTIMTGIHFLNNRPPDCTQIFCENINEAVKTGTQNKSKIIVPYQNITKTQIVLKGLRLGIDYEKTYSCYKGEENECGVCGNCIEKNNAIFKARQHIRY